jgi:hypothetical protein
MDDGRAVAEDLFSRRSCHARERSNIRATKNTAQKQLVEKHPLPDLSGFLHRAKKSGQTRQKSTQISRPPQEPGPVPNVSPMFPSCNPLKRLGLSPLFCGVGGSLDFPAVFGMGLATRGTMSEKKTRAYFVVTYREPVEGKTVMLRARRVDDSPLGLSFIRLSDFVFDTEGLVVKPEEENLRKRMERTSCIHLSIYHVISIEEVGMERAGLKFKADKANLFVLPTATRPPKD